MDGDVRSRGRGLAALGVAASSPIVRGRSTMPPKKRTEETAQDEMPVRRVCATDEVNERLLRTVPGYAEARSEIENRTSRVLAFGDAVLRTGCTEGVRDAASHRYPV
jgi:hypothetical protein